MYAVRNQVTEKYGLTPSKVNQHKQYNSLGSKLMKSTLTVTVRGHIKRALPHGNSIQKADGDLLSIVSSKPDYAIGAVKANSEGIALSKTFSVIATSSEEAVNIADFIKDSKQMFDHRIWNLVSDKVSRSELLGQISESNKRIKEAISKKFPQLKEGSREYNSLLAKHRNVFAPYTLTIVINVRHVINPEAQFGDWSNEEMRYHVGKNGILSSNARKYEINIPVWMNSQIKAADQLIKHFANEILSKHEGFELSKVGTSEQLDLDERLSAEIGVNSDLSDINDDQEAAIGTISSDIGTTDRVEKSKAFSEST